MHNVVFQLQDPSGHWDLGLVCLQLRSLQDARAQGLLGKRRQLGCMGSASTVLKSPRAPGCPQSWLEPQGRRTRCSASASFENALSQGSCPGRRSQNALLGISLTPPSTSTSSCLQEAPSRGDTAAGQAALCPATRWGRGQWAGNPPPCWGRGGEAAFSGGCGEQEAQITPTHGHQPRPAVKLPAMPPGRSIGMEGAGHQRCPSCELREEGAGLPPGQDGRGRG